jgi:hypothetical protein
MSDYILYGIPVLVFFIIALVIYVITTKNSVPDETGKIVKAPINYINFLPAVLFGIIAFGILKYKESYSEPTMMGNYFD